MITVQGWDYDGSLFPASQGPHRQSILQSRPKGSQIQLKVNLKSQGLLKEEACEEEKPCLYVVSKGGYYNQSLRRKFQGKSLSDITCSLSGLR